MGITATPASRGTCRAWRDPIQRGLVRPRASRRVVPALARSPSRALLSAVGRGETKTMQKFRTKTLSIGRFFTPTASTGVRRTLRGRLSTPRRPPRPVRGRRRSAVFELGRLPTTWQKRPNTLGIPFRLRTSAVALVALLSPVGLDAAGTALVVPVGLRPVGLLRRVELQLQLQLLLLRLLRYFACPG